MQVGGKPNVQYGAGPAPVPQGSVTLAWTVLALIAACGGRTV